LPYAKEFAEQNRVFAESFWYERIFFPIFVAKTNVHALKTTRHEKEDDDFPDAHRIPGSADRLLL
jgi:hypothetical protein